MQIIRKRVKLYTYTTNSYPKTVKCLILPDRSTPIDTIKEKLNYKGFTIRKITNVLHSQTKKPLPLFLELSPINKDIFSIDILYYTKIKIEKSHPRRYQI